LKVRFLHGPLAVALAGLALLPPSAFGDPLTGPARTWVPDGEVKAIAVSGSTAYIGGNFSRIAPYTGSSALFDATSGNLKQPWPEVAGVVNAVVPDGSGGWYLGGDFSSVAGVARTDLAHVLADGSLDPNFAPTTNGEVRALAFGAGGVFAGGEFSQANGTPRGNLAAFFPTGELTGFTGNVAGTGPHTLFDPLGVHALLLKGSKLYVGGEFNLANGVTRLRGAAFAVGNSALDTSWQPNTNRLINGLALDSDGTDVFIGGRFSQVDGPTLTADTPRNGVAKVNETDGSADPNWVAPLLGSTDLRALMVSGSQVYVGGSVRVSASETWPVASLSTVNNNAGLNINWHPVPAGSVQSLAAAGSTVYIGSGAFVDGLPQPAIMGVDATNFPPDGTPSFAPALGRGREQLPSGQSSGVRAIAASGSDVLAGGTFTNAGGVDRRNLAAMDLATGMPTAFNPPMRGQFSGLVSVESLALTSDGLVWAGGNFLTEGPDARAQLAAFDPNTGAIASFHRDPSGGVLEGVVELVASGVTVYVAGSFTSVGGVPRRNIAAVTNVPGETGTVLPFDVDVNGTVRALALAGDTLYLGGNFSEVNSGLAALKRNRRNLAAVDPTTGVTRDWDPDADNAVQSLAIAGDTVFAGGDFLTVNRSILRTRLAAFDAQNGAARSWDPRADGPVRALAVHGSTVFAGGDFATVNGGVARPGIAALDAQTGASDPLSVGLIPEERGGPLPPVARVNALFASPQTGLQVGGSYVMSAPTLRTANLAVFGLPPLPGIPPDTTDPELALTASRRLFAVGRRATPVDGNATAARARRRARRGTTLRLALSEAARVRFDVLRKSTGRRVGKRCVKPTRRNRGRKRCIRLTRRGTFRRSAPAGRSKVAFSGRIRRRALKRGHYALRATPTDAAGNTGTRRSLSITIVRP
jgi:trimeric autotransporter adhesin